jgi:uncharacterized protein (DUF2141 family)
MLLVACANIIPPTGGKMDTQAPKLVSISPADSMLNTRVTKITMRFDEFVTVSDAAKELRISPTLRANASMSYSGRTVTIKIPDSLLEANTTYTVNPGKSIKDIHESNAYTTKDYLFSTGAWFDSLQIKGSIEMAASGLADTSGNTRVFLYAASDSFTTVMAHKPLYTTVSDSKGKFRFSGLPAKSFRIYALQETDNNLIFDKDEELIGFNEQLIFPATDTASRKIRIFKELPDTSRKKVESALTQGKRALNPGKQSSNLPTLDPKIFEYRVLTDSGKTGKGTLEINKDLSILLSRKTDSIYHERIALSLDSADIELEQSFEVQLDSSGKLATLKSRWQADRVYTLRLLKGFAKDSSATDAMPSKWKFRSKKEEDYGSLEIHVPEKYRSANMLICVRKAEDSVFTHRIDSSTYKLRLLDPGTYSVCIIKDSNGDGIWNTGSVRNKQQPEEVIPNPEAIAIKAGWDNIIDFEPRKK